MHRAFTKSVHQQLNCAVRLQLMNSPRQFTTTSAVFKTIQLKGGCEPNTGGGCRMPDDRACREYIPPPPKKRNPNFGPNGEILYKLNEEGWYIGADGNRTMPVPQHLKDQQAFFQRFDGKPLWLKGKYDFYLYWFVAGNAGLGILASIYAIWFMTHLP